MSVVIPAYNRASLLHKTLESVLDSAAKDLEIVVVDDGSQDKTADVAEEIIKAHASSEVRGKVIRQANQGACTARNRGLAESTGDLVLFLDSDDEANMNGVRQAVKALRADCEVDIVYGWVNLIDSEGKVAGRKGIKPEEVRNPYFDQLWHTSGAIYRRSLLEKSGGWCASLTLGDDWEFAIRARLHARRFLYLDECMGAYIQHSGDRLTTQQFNAPKCISVLRAVLKIRSTARRLGALNQGLERRIYQRLLVQATELYLNSPHGLARRVLRVCRGQKVSPRVKLLSFLVLHSPSAKSKELVLALLHGYGKR